jgi:DNA invertase Pin-like site-specific DNA recombinase
LTVPNEGAIDVLNCVELHHKIEDFMKAVAYRRVSTEEQVRDGVSLEAQETKIRAWANLNGYSHIEIFTDAGVSGSTMERRDGLQAALESISGGDALVVYSLSRLARSTKDTLDIAEYLVNKNADLVSLSEKIDTSTAAGKMVFRMLAVLNEFERDQISERTRNALAHKKSKGERVGSIRYGYCLSDDGKTLVENPVEQKAIRIAQKCHESGMSFGGTARMLTKKGIKTRTQRDFQPVQVMRIIQSAWSSTRG